MANHLFIKYISYGTIALNYSLHAAQQPQLRYIVWILAKYVTQQTRSILDMFSFKAVLTQAGTAHDRRGLYPTPDGW